MTVRELVDKLVKYNPEATVETVVNNYPHPFELCFGGSDGGTMANCDTVTLMIDCTSEVPA